MSEAVSALKGASTFGQISVAEAGLCGMITLRGDFADAGFAQVLKDVARVDVPAQRRIVWAEERALAWMSPDELLLQLPYEEAASLTLTLSEALGQTHALVADVSDARVRFDLTGEAAAVRETLAKLAPVDFSPEAMAVGDFRRTRVAQVAGAIWFSADSNAHVICFRSVAAYAFDLLTTSAETGADVGYF